MINDRTDDGHNVISVDSLVKTYGDRQVVNGIDLSVSRGEVFGLLGPNGTGKTTTVEIIAGLRQPTSGTVTVFGVNPAVDRSHITQLLSVQPQTGSLFPTLSVIETLQLFASFYVDPLSVDSVLSLVQLDNARTSRVSVLSGGQARRLLVGVAVIGRPKMVILDEPSAGLDPVARRELWNLVKRLRDEKVTVLLTTHHMEEALELCDRLAIMVGGRIHAEGSPQQLIAEHSATTSVQFTLSAGISTNPLDEICRSDDDVKITEASGSLLVRIETDSPDALLRQITLHKDLKATNIQTVPGSLENVFVSLVEQEQAKQNSAPSDLSSSG